MELQHLLQAIDDCENGQVEFNNRTDLHCFLYKKTWYPARAVVNHASQIANENNEFNRDGAVMELHKLLSFVRIETINVQNNQLVEISNEDKKNAIKGLADLIKSLA